MEQQVDQEPKKGGLGAEAQRNQLAGMQEPWSWSEDSHGEGGAAKAWEFHRHAHVFILQNVQTTSKGRDSMCEDVLVGDRRTRKA